MFIDMKSLSFVCKTKFYAQEYFPYGLSRSGEFTREQVELLENHGRAYQALHTGVRTATNGEEENFVRACRGEREPTTVHEKAWARFCEKTSLTVAVSSPNKVDSSLLDMSFSERSFDEDL
ncbi:DUF413 domain-containing protein [Pseudoteredinibacter isoporae]|uniref:DUF413 domain-containing protein n=1 Tax=Pseudoteredinibacter isoporae TaxID=570281 RepID=UPI003109BBD9